MNNLPRIHTYATALNILWIGIAAYAFAALLEKAREAGSLLSSGE
ncbi:hypothetical protein [Phreatobacter oligotrophus]|uniref:Uncharacterized protein n=1 Tax=Phreatobacter oligotrophus TaxID=1122261 RepID=A0A2T4YWL7_9HYPH|nr:hypothetical protein [Phreatobacter oligotrophus]PTM49057.1 hypothetical protein C8P69_12110 [Phreatobacter oligotrophus]